MLEPLTALSLASAVVQLVDFSARVSRETYSLVKDAKEAPNLHANLQESSKLNESLNDNLLGLLATRDNLDEDELLLKPIVETLKAKIAALFGVLEKLVVKPRPDGSRSLGRKIEVAFRAEFNRSGTEAMVQEIEHLQRRVSNVLIHLIRKHQTLQQNEFLSCIAQYGISNTASIAAVRTDLLQVINEQRGQIALYHQQSSLDAHERIRAAEATIVQAMEQQHRTLITQFSRRLDNLTASQDIAQKSQTLLASLDFAGMERRKNAIPDNAEGTFDWVFNDSSSLFGNWLKEDSPLFCIFGKAGCGKSTFMRFLSDDRRTREALGVWRGDSTLIMADHYFWYSGEAMQKTHQGLLRSLLYGVLSTNPSLAAFICPQRWQSGRRDLPRSWTREELLQSLKNIRHLTDTKVFFLVDGLDEYYPHDSHRLLVDDLRKLLEVPNVKICVSSRPWPVFAQAFKTTDRLLLEEFNGSDIQHYASDEIKYATSQCGWGDTDILSSQETQLLVQEISQRADGVFLWVYLAVKALTERLRAGANIRQLQKCLQDFPKDLGDYFNTMIYQRISSTWQEGSETAQALKMAMLLAEDQRDSTGQEQDELNPRSFLNYWFLCKNQGPLSDNFAFERPIIQVSAKEVGRMIQQTDAFLSHCTRDLLSIVARHECDFMNHNSVDFAHRTVYDFLLTADMQSLLDHQVPSHFRQPMFRSHLALARLKVIPLIPQVEISAEASCKYCTAFVDQTWISGRQPTAPAIIAEIDRVACVYPIEICYEERSRSRSPSPILRPSLISSPSPRPRPNSRTPSPRSRTPSPIPSRSSYLGGMGMNLLLQPFERGRTHEKTSVTVCKAVRLLDYLICNDQQDGALKAIAYRPSRDLVGELIFSALGVSTLLTGTPFPAEKVNIPLLTKILEHRGDPNIPTKNFKAMNRSSWHLFLRSWLRRAWLGDYAPGPGANLADLRPRLTEIDTKFWPVARLLLCKGASMRGSCCVGTTTRCGQYYREHDCVLYPVMEILECCAPMEHHDELQSMQQRESFERRGTVKRRHGE